MFSRSAQTARRADPPGPLFHRAIAAAVGAGAGAGSGTRPGADSDARPEADSDARAGVVSGADPGIGPGADRGIGPAVGTGAVCQDSGRVRRGDDGAVSGGGAAPGRGAVCAGGGVSGGGLASLAAVVPGEAADPVAGPRLCFPPSNESPPCPAAGLLVPLRR